MSEPIKLSSSGIGNFIKCQKLFYFNKLSGLGDRDFTSAAIERGSLFHAGIAAALRQTNPKLNLKAATEAVDELYVQGTGSSAERDEAVEMLAHFLPDLGINTRNFAHRLNGESMVEWMFDEDFGAFSLRGSIDAVIRDTDGRIFLVDWKSRRSFYSTEVIRQDRQLYIYAAILKREGIELDGAMQIQLSPQVPQPPKFKVGSDVNLASSLNERSGKTTKEMFEAAIAHMTPSERLLAQMKVGNKVAEPGQFKQISAIDLADVDNVFNAALAWGNRIANEREFLPTLDAYVCKDCQWIVECRASLKVQ